MPTAREILEVPLSPRDRRLLLRLARSGRAPGHLERVFAPPAVARPTVLDAARHEPDRYARPLPARLSAAANDNHGAGAPPTEPIDRAMRTLGGRAVETAAGLWLDGVRVRAAEIVAAARALGADIPYPGIAAPPRAFHTGPSARPARRRRARRGG